MAWQMKKLGDVCRVINGRAYKKSEMLHQGKYPLLRVGNFFTNTNWYYSDLELDPDKYCDDGDLLYAWSASFGPRIWNGGKVIYHYHIWKIELDESQVTKEYLYWLLDWDKELIKKQQGAGTTMVHVTKGSMESRVIPVPPLAEQKQIVAILDEAFANIDHARQLAERNLKNVRELLDSTLKQVFTDSLEGWRKIFFSDDSFIKIIDGDRGKNYPNKSDFSDTGYCLFLNTKNVRLNGFSFKECMFIDKTKNEKLRNGQLNKWDVVITTRGTIGNIAIFDDSVEFEVIRINSGMLILRCNQKVISPEYLFNVLKAPVFKDQVEAAISGAAQPQLPIKSLIKLHIPVPKDLQKQQDIVSKVRDITSEAERLELIYQQKISALDELKQSLLQKAFRGELTQGKAAA